jgi:hypothetical protein
MKYIRYVCTDVFPVIRRRLWITTSVSSINSNQLGADLRRIMILVRAQVGYFEERGC